MIRIGICDDDRDYARLLADLVSRTPDLDLVWVCHDGAEVLTPERWSAIDVLLLDVRMPAPNGLTVARELKREAAGLQVLFLTCFEESSIVRTAIELRLGGMLPKASPSKSILHAIRSAHDGVQVFAPRATARLFERAEQRRDDKPISLSDRDRQLLRLVAAGHPNAVIASELCLAESTVKGLLGGLFRTFSVRSRAQLIARLHAWEVNLN
ncbi:MAG: response regulator transcription factor [Propionibacteriaceae bacterium]|nr:response regulator transcription factor [Propionibacteriaceae bacterium]